VRAPGNLELLQSSRAGRVRTVGGGKVGIWGRATRAWALGAWGSRQVEVGWKHFGSIEEKQARPVGVGAVA
jgi:hypothetical protein